MFKHTLTPEERLKQWRKIRQHNHETVDELLSDFAAIEIQPRFLDYFTPSSWPNVFEIVSNGMLCQTGTTLVLVATMLHKGFITSEELEFLVISNNNDGTDGIVLLYDNMVYNFVPGEAVPLTYLKENAVIFDTHTVPVTDIFS